MMQLFAIQRPQWTAVLRSITMPFLLGLLLTSWEAICAEAGLPRESVILELQTPAAARVFADMAPTKANATAVVREHLARIENEQQAVLEIISSKAQGTQEIYRTQRVYNGIAVQADPSQIEALRDIPGVKAVHRLHPVSLRTTTSIPFLGLPAVWGQVGVTGKGISIGIVDCGIDYIHPDFGGSGSPLEHAENNTRILGDVPFPTPKVAGGYDFVGDDYDPFTEAASLPQPDPDPYDQLGHGTHVAGIAAGCGVTREGAPYLGPYDLTAPINTMQIGPGGAPEATLYALKVFGASSITYVIIPAIDWAMDPNSDGDFSDHLDVLNLSLGDDATPGDSPLGVACSTAAAAGILVVAAAGNANDGYFVMSSPGSSPEVLCVAASKDSDSNYPSMLPDHIASFSSRGPAVLNEGRFLLKPDISAPGQSIESAAAYTTGSSAIVRLLSGTSMACPHVSGIMALLRQQHPDWTVQELKCLIMNTATYDVYTNTPEVPAPCSPVRSGAGRANTDSALRNEVLAFSASMPSAVSITFSTTEVSETAEEVQVLRVFNKGETAAAFQVTMDPRSSIPGVEITLGNSTTGLIEPGQTVDLPLTLHAEASAMKHSRDPGTYESLGGVTRSWISEVSGYVVLTPLSSGEPIRTAYYGSLRPVSSMHSTEPVISAGTTTDLTVHLSGTDLDTGTDYPRDITSLVSPFELVLYSPDEPSSTGLENAADIHLAGVRSDYGEPGGPGQNLDDTTVYFGISTHGSWFTPYWTMFMINIDINRDGQAEYAVYNVPEYSFTMNDIFTVRISDFQSADTVISALNGYGADEYDTVPFMSNVLVFPVPVRLLHLQADHPRFYFWVQTYLLPELPVPRLKRIIDKTSLATFDPTHPGLSFPGITGAMRSDLSGETLPVIYDEAAYRANGTLVSHFGMYVPSGSYGIGLFHHHNARGQKAEWLPVLTASDSDGDNITDAVEGGEDSDNDGLPNYLDPDSDDDGISDLLETALDMDNDHLGNFVDQDSDGDTLLDASESVQYHTNPYSPDSDADTIPDNIDGVIDTDSDGTINALDTDSDADDIPDAVEGTGDPDIDHAPNFVDLDSDGDGLSDKTEGTADVDTDTIPNYLDLDSDGDTLPDADERFSGTNPYLADTDQDGLNDNVDPNPLTPQTPGAPQNVQASAGTFPDKVRLTWNALPGAAEYRVLRSEDSDPAHATVLNPEWQTGAAWDDTTAVAPDAPAFGCFGDAQPRIYTYWVQARIAPSGGTATEAGPLSAPVQGYRGSGS